MTPLQMELHTARKERLARMNVTPRPTAVLVQRAPVEPEVQGPPAPPPIEAWWRELEERRPVNLSIWLIQKTVALHYGTSVDVICSPRRQGHMMRPRFVAAWLCHTLTSNSYSEIGRQFRKDHSTIMYACHKTRDDAASDPVFGKELLALYDRLEALQEPV
jgi:hypothetical protein